MTLKLEVGKKYRNRKGEVIEITEYDHGHVMPFGSHFNNIDEIWYMQNGRFFSNREDDNDLIEEVIEPQELAQEPVKNPHKHAELIKAWADGAEIETKNENVVGGWVSQGKPEWHDDWEYRIKPAPKPDVVELYHLVRDSQGIYSSVGRVNIKLIFDGTTGELKDAEVLK